MSINRQHRREIERGESSEGASGDPGPVFDASTSIVEPDEERRGVLDTTTHRFAPRQFLHEVNVEMRKVAWPTRTETINYSTVVFVTLALLMALIFGLDYAFSKAAGFIFNP